MMYDTEYEKVVNDINNALDQLRGSSDAHVAVIEKLTDMWRDNEANFYEDLDIRKYANSPSKSLTGQQQIDRFNKAIGDFLHDSE